MTIALLFLVHNHFYFTDKRNFDPERNRVCVLLNGCYSTEQCILNCPLLEARGWSQSYVPDSVVYMYHKSCAESVRSPDLTMSCQPHSSSYVEVHMYTSKHRCLQSTKTHRPRSLLAAVRAHLCHALRANLLHTLLATLQTDKLVLSMWQTNADATVCRAEPAIYTALSTYRR